MDRAAKARKLLATHHAELDTLVREASETGLFDAAFERMKRWKARTVEALRLHVHSREGDRLAGMRKTWFSGDTLENLVDEAKMYDGFIRALDAELKQHPKSVLNQDGKTKSVGSPSTIPLGSVVFLVHGHDELNLLRLKEVLATRWKLEPVILSSEAGKGRTIIEKFEGEAARATFAFVLMSPDDQISAPQGGYAQSRPNVIFELGWFYGRLGRDRVCILFKKGTHIHSDLDGVSRIEFVASVNEKIEEIERELTTAKVLGKRSRSAGV